MTEHYYSIPIELMEILNRINDNVNEVKERVTRIEAQDHSDRIRVIMVDVEKERDERIKLQIAIEGIKTKLAPIVIGISMAGAVIIETVIKSIH